MEKLIAAKQWNKVFFENNQKHRIKVIAELHSIGGQTPYFSVTGEVDRQAKNNRWMPFLSGCIHDEILQHFPQLQPLVDIHLSDENGVPMHAYANAGYWAGQTKWQELDLVKLSNHLRISQTLAHDMVNHIDQFWGELDQITTPTMAWEGACQDYGLIEQWSDQANVAKSMLNIVQEVSA
jgi:hypothetical protein